MQTITERKHKQSPLSLPCLLFKVVWAACPLLFSICNSALSPTVFKNKKATIGGDDFSCSSEFSFTGRSADYTAACCLTDFIACLILQQRPGPKTCAPSHGQKMKSELFMQLARNTFHKTLLYYT